MRYSDIAFSAAALAASPPFTMPPKSQQLAISSRSILALHHHFFLVMASARRMMFPLCAVQSSFKSPVHSYFTLPIMKNHSGVRGIHSELFSMALMDAKTRFNLFFRHRKASSKKAPDSPPAQLSQTVTGGAMWCATFLPRLNAVLSLSSDFDHRRLSTFEAIRDSLCWLVKTSFDYNKFWHWYLLIRYPHFIRYVYDFYRPGWLYPYCFNRLEITAALHIYLRSDKWCGGDSLDRENVRDLIFRERGEYGELAR